MVQWDSGSDRIEAFTNLIRRAPFLAIPMVVCLMSLVGLPPLAGFLGKWWILWALGGMHGVTGASPSLVALGWVLIIVAAVNTLISLYYYVRVVVQMILRDDQREAARTPVGGVVLVNACAIALLVLFIFAGPVRNAADRYARNLYVSTSPTQTAAPIPTSEALATLSAN
jgi:NADH-quinone oxidoreductase subunit N